ncbi:MAG: UDP-N-acetylmuramate--L-alanine ligase [Bacteroidota bacterium]
MNIDQLESIYFVGIGGIGMSALARYFNSQGIRVSGYDKTESPLTKKLVEEGIDIHYEEDISQLPEKIDWVVFTPAVPNTHFELVHLKAQGLPVMKRSEVLGLISKSRPTIAVAGTHGKTSTSSIITWLLHYGDVDCTAFLGGIAMNFDSNYVEGKGDWVVVEADEYDRSFLQLQPDLAIILSMDADHLDIYGDLRELHQSFLDFTACIKPSGQLFAKEGLPIETNIPTQRFGLGKGSHRAQNIRTEQGYVLFDYHSPKGKIADIRFTMPGHHNVENATAAIAIAEDLGLRGETIKEALALFKGIKRRFEIIYRDERVVYIDDYAHHPTELAAAIQAARSLFPKRKITAIFQPHLYSRTRDFVDGFAQSLDAVDELLLLDIYPARELPIEGVHANLILDRMKNPNRQLVEKSQLLAVVQAQSPEVLLTLGAGDIDRFVKPLKELLSK